MIAHMTIELSQGNSTHQTMVIGDLNIIFIPNFYTIVIKKKFACAIVRYGSTPFLCVHCVCSNYT